METPSAYLPIDRRHAMAAGRELAYQTRGAALFADISGFTPLTEALVRALGPQRGAEELPRQLNLIYDALIAEVDRFGGSVIGFSGDAITCWFDGDSGLRATACALQMQQVMAPFAAVQIPGGGTVSLAIHVAVAAGPARRFVVGEPQIQLVDVLAGETLDRLAAAEHLASKGEVILDGETWAALREQVVAAARYDGDLASPSGVVEQLMEMPAPAPWPPLSPDALPDDQTRAWLLWPVYERLNSGLGEFLTELRPATALFLRFTGIDYDHDPAAHKKLDDYVRWVQGILVRYGGFLIQLTVGDKGSYLYAAFGAPVAHDDDTRRAVAAALELRATPPELGFIEPVQIGISQGRMRTGAYGGQTRRTYGVLGDETNLAARLMQHAPPGTILVSAAAQRLVPDAFVWEPLPALRVKGKTEPIAVFRPLAVRLAGDGRLQEQRDRIPMVGRAAELALVQQKLEEVATGRGQIVGIMAEAGMGKSRLVVEISRLAAERQWTCFAGECQSYGTNTSYHVWEPIWRAFFGVDGSASLEEQIATLEAALTVADPGLMPRLPLLGTALNLPIPDNDLTASLDAKLRKTSLEMLLADCVWARARTGPLLFILEDCHWCDPLSQDLLDTLGRACADLAVLFLIAYRPPLSEHEPPQPVTLLPNCTVLALTEFTPEEAERLVALKLKEIIRSDAAVPEAVTARIMERADGNPFYIEELINYLRDRGLDPQDVSALDRIELPTSLHSLILSRIDQLSEQQKLTLKIASVVGRLFHLHWLWGVHPGLGQAERVQADLEAMGRRDLVQIDLPDPDWSYLFKHIVTREVAYESLPFATRAVLHGQLGEFIEAQYADTLDQYLDLLAYHYDHSHNEAKKREYLRKAGEAAQAIFANDAAIGYYQRLVNLPNPDDLRQQIHLRLGEVLAITGQYDATLNHLYEALNLSTTAADHGAQARACRWIAFVHEFRGDFPLALDWIQRGLDALHGSSDQGVTAEAELLAIAGLIATRQGDYTQAQIHCDRSIEVAEALGAMTTLAFAYNSRAIIAYHQGQSTSAFTHFDKALAAYERTGNVHGQAMSYNGIGHTYQNMGQWAEASQYLSRARDIFHQTGDVLHLAFTLNNLGEIARSQGRIDEALRAYQEALRSVRQLGASMYAIGVVHMNLGATFILQPDLDAAYEHLRMSETCFAQANTRDFLPELHRHFAEAALVAGDHAEASAQAQTALRLARELSMHGEEGSCLRTLGEIELGRGRLDAAEQYLVESLTILEEVQYEYEAARTRFWLAGVYAAQGQHGRSAGMVEQASTVFDRLSAPDDTTVQHTPG